MHTKSSGTSHIMELAKNSETFFKEILPHLQVESVPKFLIEECKKLPHGKALNSVKELIAPVVNGKISHDHAAKVLLSREMIFKNNMFPDTNAREAQAKRYQNFYDKAAAIVKKHGDKILVIKKEELEEA